MLVDQGTKSGQTRHPCSSSYIAHCGASASLHLKPQTSSAWSNRNCHKSIEASRGDTPRCGHLAAAPTRNPQELHRTLTWRRSEISSWPAALRSRHLEPKYTQRTEIHCHSTGTQQTLMFLAIFQWRIPLLNFRQKKGLQHLGSGTMASTSLAPQCGFPMPILAAKAILSKIDCKKIASGSQESIWGRDNAAPSSR